MNGWERYRARLTQLQETAESHECYLSNVFWHEFDEDRYRLRRSYLKELIALIVKATGRAQKDIALGLGVCEATLPACKNGSVSLKLLERLQAYARFVGQIDVPPLPDLPDTVADAEAATMRMMLRLRELRKETTVRPLDCDTYRAVREVAGSNSWWQALTRNDREEAAQLAAELLGLDGVDGPTSQWLLAVVDEWWPVFIVCVDHIQSGSNLKE